MKKLIVFICVSVFISAIYAQTETNEIPQVRVAINHGPYLQNLKETEVTIVWIANKASVGWVELAPDDGTHFYQVERPKRYNVSNGLRNISLVHSVTISGLEPGTRYRYRIYSQEVLEHRSWEVIYGRVAATGVYTREPLTFTTNDRNKPETSFIMVNDIHGRADDIRQMMEVAEHSTVDMVIFNGDMLNFFVNEAGIFSGFMDAAIEVFAKETPMYYARGNHETRGQFSFNFHDYFSQGEPHLYYMVRQGPVCFIFLDTGEDKPDTDIEYSGLADFDNYRTQQAQWLAKAVQSKEFTDAKFRIVISHKPPVSSGLLWHGQREILEKFVPILNDANADLMLCGHLHRRLIFAPNESIKFPIIVNAHRTVLKGVVKDNQLELSILDLEGNILDKHVVDAK